MNNRPFTYTLANAQAQFGRRFRQCLNLLHDEGVSELANRLKQAAAERLASATLPLPVEKRDVLAADLSRPFQPEVPRIDSNQKIVVNWVTIPARARSGGHTTIFRVIRYLQSHGYSNRLYFYNVYQSDFRYYESIARDYYGFEGPISSIDRGIEDAHAIVATSWPTAYPVYNARCAGKRFYFVQDFEPLFYPVGALSLLAENTYRMGFHAITAGGWLAEKLAGEFDVVADSFAFGCDTSRYFLQDAKRSGIVFYVRPEAARRGVELGLMALELFASRHPHIEIHLYGAKMGKLPFRYVNHGRIGPDELNRLYNICYAGLSLSFTNVSLVPHEMLAAGCIPIVNDAVQNRKVLDNPFVRYVAPCPHALVSELETIINNSDVESAAKMAAASVRFTSWDDASSRVASIIETALRRSAVAANASTCDGRVMSMLDE
jgi:hypothetical protein